jgi:hypothetical protein
VIRESLMIQSGSTKLAEAPAGFRIDAGEDLA